MRAIFINSASPEIYLEHSGIPYSDPRSWDLEDGRPQYMHIRLFRACGIPVDEIRFGRNIIAIRYDDGEIVAIGDGANDQIMIQNAGLGIAFNAKEVLKKTADGIMTTDNLKGLLYCLGASEKEISDSK